MEGSKVIQQLLRPTDTCVIVYVERETQPTSTMLVPLTSSPITVVSSASPTLGESELEVHKKALPHVCLSRHPTIGNGLLVFTSKLPQQSKAHIYPLAVVQGYLLGVTPPSRRFIAIIKHEGTEEHALFLFELDTLNSPVTVKVEAFYPIKGSFSVEVKATQASQCELLLNNGAGSSIALQLAYDGHTAVFISQINKALHQFDKSSTADSSSSFLWLVGYENCRTGWDRFSKPNAQSPGPGGLLSDSYMRGGFPDSWPWSHIITPNSDGTTEIAHCEILENFDPLRSKSPAKSASPTNPVELMVTHSPSSSPASTRNPFYAPDNVNPFLSSSPPTASNGLSTGKEAEQLHKPQSRVMSKRHFSPTKTGSSNEDRNSLKHCISDTNLNKLKSEIKPLRPASPHMTRSQEDLTATLDMPPSARHCVAPKNNSSSYSKNGQSSKNTSGRRKENNEELSKSLFFVPLEESDWVTFDDNDMDSLTNSTTVGNSKVTRQVRSSETSPTTSRRTTTTTTSKLLPGSKHKLEFLNPSGIKAITSNANMRSPELSGKRNRKGLGKGRDRSKSALPPGVIVGGSGVGGVAGKKSSQWVSRYRPGVAVPIPGETARESIMQSELRHRENEFCSPVQIRMFVATWNVNGRTPSSLDPLLKDFGVKGEKDPPVPHIFAIGFQELDLSAQCLLYGESNREEMWVECMEQSLRAVGSYTKLCCVRLVGIMLLVYIEDSLLPHVSDVEVAQIATGMHGYMGNKGGVGLHFNLYHSSLCFVNTHFSAHMEEVEKRNHEFNLIMDKMTFTTSDIAYNIVQHDMIIWLGDLNYRIVTTPEMTSEQIKVHADLFQFPALLKLDQLMIEKKKNSVFWGFEEALIDFKPTYKYDPNTDNWDSSEKHRAPAWCDRILFRGNGITQQCYTSHPALTISDHKPVSGVFDATLREVDPEKEKGVLEQITWRLDKLENDTLPQVDLNVTEFRFKDVRFLVPQVKRLVVTNTGQRPIHISFIPKLDDKKLTKDWLTVKPTSAVIHPLCDAVMNFIVLVDEDSAPPLTSGKELFEDILVLHLEKGKDFFITVSGNYLPSCFGSSLETLVNLHTYIREVPVAKLVDLTSSWEECALENKPSPDAPPALDVPKELFAITDFIQRTGIGKEGLFSDGGRQHELEEIRDMLDTGGRDLPGSVFSVASILLTFLAALAEPVVPVSFHSRCMDCCNNATLCKQILSQMPVVHKKTFVFLTDFMKNLLRHSEDNGLDPKLLATVFGEVLLKTPLNERKTKSRKQLSTMNGKKATFLYQFIINDLTSSSK